MNTADFLVKFLEDNGVEYIFGLPGEQVLPLYEAIRKSSIEHVLVRHEQVAVGAADGYARCTGNYGVCIATAGPGALNMVMSTATAYKDNVPLIVITADVDSSIKGLDRFQDVDINGVFEPVTYKSYNINNEDAIVDALGDISSYRNSGISGVFHINMPKDVQNKKIDIHTKLEIKNYLPMPSESIVDSIIKLIEESERPLIIAGSGIIYSHAQDELKEFLDKTKIPLTTTFPARGIIPEDDPQNLGIIGIRSKEKSRYASENADLVIALATRLTDRTRAHIETSNIIQVNSLEEHKQVENFYNLDAKKLLEQLNRNKLPETNKTWLDKINSIQEDNTVTIPETRSGLHPRRVVDTILSYMDENTTITIDAGTTTTYFTIDSLLTKNSQVLFSGGFGPMGYSIPASIGVAFTRSDDVVFAATGDGSFQMTCQDLAVISTYQLPIIIFIINNQLLGIIKQWQDMNNMENYQVELDNPDFIKLAEAYDIEADNITSIEQLEEKLREAIDKRKPHLFNINVIDVPIPMPK